MSKKVKILVAVLAAVVLLSVVGTASVMAQGGSTSANQTETTNKGLLARAAEILGIPQDELTAAFKQAQQEMREEAITRALAKAVEKGRLTEEQANEIKEWWQQKPEALGPGMAPFAFGRPGFHGGHTGMGHRGRGHGTMPMQ